MLKTGNILQVTDSLAGVGQSAAIVDGAGLFRVQFSVAANAASSLVHISLTQAVLSDADNNPMTLGTVTAGSITVVNASPPEVTGVAFGSSSWTSPFPDLGGYPIPSGSAQLNPLPWFKLDTVSITFNEAVTVTQGSLAITGINVASYASSGFSYNSATLTATWTFATAFDDDRLTLALASTGANAVTGGGLALDGEWTNGVSTFSSGDGTPGGDFDFNVNILPGDVNATGTVNILDTVVTRNHQFSSFGSGNYSILDDVDGNGSVSIIDTIDVRNRQFTGLPTVPSPGAVGSMSSVTPAAALHCKQRTLRSRPRPRIPWLRTSIHRPASSRVCSGQCCRADCQ